MDVVGIASCLGKTVLRVCWMAVISWVITLGHFVEMVDGVWCLCVRWTSSVSQHFVFVCGSSAEIIEMHHANRELVPVQIVPGIWWTYWFSNCVG